MAVLFHGVCATLVIPLTRNLYSLVGVGVFTHNQQDYQQTPSLLLL